MGDAEVGWEALLSLAPVPMTVLDGDGRIVAANDTFATLLARRPGTLAGLGLEAFVRAEDLAWTRRSLRRLVQGEFERFGADQLYVRDDGRHLLVRASCRPLVGEEGEPVHVLLAATELPQEYGAVEAGVADRLLDFGSESVTLVDATGRIRTTRGAQIPVQGVPSTFWQGRTISELLAPGEWDRLLELRRQAATPGEAIEVDVEVTTGDGATRTIEARVVNCLDDPLLDGYVVVARDITDERAGVAELAQQRRTAEAVVEAQTRMLATVSHELRNPLHAAHGIAELIAADALTPAAADLAASLVRQLASLSRVTQDLLDAARLEAGDLLLQPAPTDLRALVGDVVEFGRAAAGTGRLAITSRVAHGVPRWVLVDSDRLRQVLTNLVGNAVKFTERGSVQLVVRPETAGVVRFSVIDTGVGIPAGEHGAVLEPFTIGSTAGTAGGAGIGLSVVEQLVDAMQGTIELRSTVGLGTRVDVAVPLPVCEPPASVERATPASHLRVLVVEDNLVNQQLAHRQLERLGFDAVVVGSGEEGVELLGRGGPGAFDVVLLDHQLPGWNGVETTRRIRGLGGAVGAVPIVGVSASTTGDDRAGFLAAGMDDFIAKPASLQDLAGAIRKVCSRRDDDPSGGRPTGEPGPGHLPPGEVLDVGVLASLVDELADRDVVDGLVGTFVAGLADRVDAVTAGGDPAAVGRAAHALRSTAQLVGANELADLCRRIEHEPAAASELPAAAARAQSKLERWRLAADR